MRYISPIECHRRLLVLAAAFLTMLSTRVLAAENIPPVCTASCERRLVGADALNVGDEPVRKKVEDYYDDVSTRGLQWWGGQALRYGGAAAAGAISTGGGGMAWGAAAAGGALLSNDIGGYLVESHHEAVTKDLLIMANREMNGTLFETDEDGTSRVNLAALEREGALSFLLSDEFYTKIDGEHREALRFVRQNLSIGLLTDVARDVRITAEDVAYSRATVVATYQAVVGNEDYLKQLLNGQEAHKAALEGLARTSNDAAEQLQLLEAASMQQLSPRQKLALQQQGMLALTAAEKATYENAVLVDDIAHTGQQFSAVLSGIAQLPGLSPKAVAKINRANQLVNVGVACATAYLTGDPMSVMSAIGGIAGILGGGGGGPSPEVQMLQAVMARLDQIERKLDQYHKEEMQALQQINTNLFQVQDVILRQMRETQLMVLDNSRALGELLSNDIKACDTLMRRYAESVNGLNRVNQVSFSAFFESDLPAYGAYFGQCRRGVGDRLTPKISSIFTPLFPPDIAQDPVGDFAKARLFVQMTLKPTLNFYRKHRLATEKVRRNLMSHVPTMIGLADRLSHDPPRDLSLPLPEARLAIQDGGYRMLDPREVINTAAAARTVLEMVPSFYSVGGEMIRPITREIVASCEGKARADCPILPGTEASRQLHDFEQLLSVLLLQENLVAGLPAVELVAKELDGELTEAIPQFAPGKEPAQRRQKLFSYSSLEAAHVADGDLKTPRCDTGNAALDSVCAIQANPILAQNALTLFVSNRIGSAKQRLSAYRAALEWEGVGPLQLVLGPDVILHNAALDLPSSPEGAELRRRPRWAILLPRAFAYVDGEDSKVTDRAPSSCWDDPEGNVLRVSKRRDYAHLPIHQRQYMRCYLLPPSEVVAAVSVTTRPFVDDAELERTAVAATIRAITLGPPPGEAAAN